MELQLQYFRVAKQPLTGKLNGTKSGQHYEVKGLGKIPKSNHMTVCNSGNMQV